MTKHGTRQARRENPAGRSKRRSGRGMRIVGWVSVVMTAVLVVASLSGYGFYRTLASNIAQEDVAGRLGSNRPADSSKAANILLLGSDTRSAAGTRKYGEASGARSDTVILLHLPPGRDRALAISFPRDLVVDVPACKRDNGSMSQPTEGRLNKAFQIGGPACTWKTIESLTDIRIDHFVMVNFAGFKNVVNALGGVRVCLPQPVSDRRSGLTLQAGSQVIKGEQALGFVRVRHGIGNGSDLERIQRQQEFLAGMVKKATSRDLLLNPAKLYGFLSAATKSLTTDTDFGLRGLQRLALSAKGIKPADIKFVTAPVQGTGDHATVALRQPAASQLFTAVQDDKKLPQQGGTSTRAGSSPGSRGSGGAASSTGSSAAKPTVPPEGVQVKVLNGTDISGLAGETADKLEAAGFEVTDVGNADGQAYEQTTVRHDPELEASAKILAGSVGNAEIESDEDVGRSVELVLGEDAQDLQVERNSSQGGGNASGGAGGSGNGGSAQQGGRSGSSPVPEGVEKINASQNACATNSLQ